MSKNSQWDETFVDAKVTYHIEIEGKLILVPNVPARVNVETGERMFSPDTVEHLQNLVRSRRRPVQTVERNTGLRLHLNLVEFWVFKSYKLCKFASNVLEEDRVQEH